MANPQELYRQALAAQDEGETDEAMRLLAEALSEDETFLNAWIKLAEIMPDSEDKFDVLQQILELDPQNYYARQELERLNIVLASAEEEEARRTLIQKSKAETGEEFLPGITRREMRLVVTGLTIFTLVMLFFSFMVRGFWAVQRRAQESEATQIALAPQLTYEANATALAGTDTVNNQLQTEGAQTAQANVTPPTSTRAFSLPTEIPPTATATAVVGRVLAPPPEDSGISGRILAYGGTNPSARDFLPLRSYNAGDGTEAQRNMTEYPNVLVRSATTDIVHSRIIAEAFDPRERVGLITEFSGSNPAEIVSVPGDFIGRVASNAQKPVLSVTGNDMVMVAEDAEGQQQLYIVTFETEAGIPDVTRITDDNFTYFSAAIAPNGRRVIAARRDFDGVDLVEIDLEAGTAPNFSKRELTGDGDLTIEDMPRYAPDGERIVYTTAPSDARSSRNIILQNIATGERTTVSDDPADDLNPHFSPDSRYIVFASNRSGVYNLYIYDRISSLTYQLTESIELPVFPAGWSN